MDATEFNNFLAQFPKLTPLQRERAINTLTGLTQPQPDLAKSLRQWRMQEGLSQSVAANKIGISRTRLSQIENQRSEPSKRLTQRIQALIKASTMSTPENDLWASVLEQALSDLSERLYRQKALLWFSSREHHPGSFLFICDALNLDPRKVLAFAKQRKKVSFAVNTTDSTDRIVFKPPPAKKEFDLTPLQRQHIIETPVNFALTLCSWRKQREFITQAEAAARLGISKSSYAEIERGDKLPTKQLEQRILDLCAQKSDKQ